MANIEIRAAQAHDRDKVLAFCTATGEWGDYIDQVWQKWLEDKQGELLVAVTDNEPVGLIHLQLQDMENAWIEGLRVNPSYRSQGIARALLERSLLIAIQQNRNYARMTTADDNLISLHLAKSLHMREVSTFVLYETEALQEPARRANRQRSQLATLDDLDDIINYLNVSNIFPLVGGLYNDHFSSIPVTASLLEEKIIGHQLYVLKRWDRIDGLAILALPEDRDARRASVGYIDGTAIEAISLLAYDLQRDLGQMEIERLRIYAPDLVMIHDALTGLGYVSSGNRFITLERSLQ